MESRSQPPALKKTFLDLKTMDTIAQQFGVYWPNFIAQVILFAIVYFVLRKYAFGPIVAMLEERRRRIEEGQQRPGLDRLLLIAKAFQFQTLEQLFGALPTEAMIADTKLPGS